MTCPTAAALARNPAPALLACAALAACGGSSPSSHRLPPASHSVGIPRTLLEEARPIGKEARFHPPATGPIGGPCRASLGSRDQVHLEVFAANRVVIVPAGIGVSSPRQSPSSRVVSARCYGPLVTIEPTGVVLVRPGLHADVAQLFRAWGLTLSSARVGSFTAPRKGRVRVFLDGRPCPGPPGAVALTQHAEIVIEIGPYVPPHSSFRFPKEP